MSKSEINLQTPNTQHIAVSHMTKTNEHINSCMYSYTVNNLTLVSDLFEN